MARVLLINPSYLRVYHATRAGAVVPVFPTLGLAAIAASTRRAGHKVRILDLSYRDYVPAEVREEVVRWKPDVVGITAPTPLMNQLRDISCVVKDISSGITVVGGGPHPSSLPEETLFESMLDAVVAGEGDETFVEVANGEDLRGIAGICRRDGDGVVMNPPRPLVENLDDLPIPAWDLYDAAAYSSRCSRILVKHPPASMVEFSRGCVFRCDFCGSKNTVGYGLRRKSPERCAEEMEALHRLGFREALLADDIFTSHNEWAESVCDAISRRGTRMAWTCSNGIRVDSASPSLFRSMQRAGCYRVHFGFESGNNEVLKTFGKGGRATLEQGRDAVRMAREAGLDTFGMFMVGLSADTEASMLDTIEYARSLPVDMMRCGITVPLPGSKMFTEFRRLGRIKSYNWDLYDVYNTRPIFDHLTLSWSVIERYYNLFYRKAFYRNPAFLWRRFLRGIRTGEFMEDLRGLITLIGSTQRQRQSFEYACRDRWPSHDFRPDNIRPVTVLRPGGSSHEEPKVQLSAADKPGKAVVV